jgi:hypothetical protein
MVCKTGVYAVLLPVLSFFTNPSYRRAEVLVIFRGYVGAVSGKVMQSLIGKGCRNLLPAGFYSG